MIRAAQAAAAQAAFVQEQVYLLPQELTIRLRLAAVALPNQMVLIQYLAPLPQLAAGAALLLAQILLAVMAGLAVALVDLEERQQVMATPQAQARRRAIMVVGRDSMAAVVVAARQQQALQRQVTVLQTVPLEALGLPLVFLAVP